MHLLIILFVGAVAGLLAGLIVQGEGFGLLVDILVGIVGGWIGWKLFGAKLSITHSLMINEIITATVGAIILTAVIKLLRGLMR